MYVFVYYYLKQRALISGEGSVYRPCVQSHIAERIQLMSF